MMKAVVGERGQITIPKAVREKLGVVPGTILDVREENGCVIAVKVIREDPVAQVRGCLQLDVSVDTFIKQLRGDA
jgi:antitoxin PrlF